ncbi:MAG TPA: Ig-like domain-containing protein [Blastocatellia bacterium]|nr:Ig-like domain-containing protein [Blastocatellia bacterium]
MLYAAEASVKAGAWSVVADQSAAGGSRIHNADSASPKLPAPLANPAHYFEMSFQAEAGRPYRLWVRGKAQNDHWGNDSVYVQFSGSVNSSGGAVYRIGTTAGTEVNLEDCSGCGLSGWGWQDNGWGVGVLGPVIYFQTTGTQTLRVQPREDGLSIDQIVLSTSTYLNSSPGALKNDTTIIPKSGGGGSQPVTLVRQPYLQQVSSNSAIIVWATREPGPADARYRLNGGPETVVPAATTLFSSATTGLPFDYYQHEARLAHLSPATRYAYDIFVRGADATPGITDSLATAPANATGAVRFIAFGDSGIGSIEQRQLATRMAADSFDLALHTGDVVYGSSDTSGAADYLQYHNWFFDVYKDWLRSRPMFPSIGNHDDRILGARAYRDLFVLPENGASAARPDHAERYYSFDYGPAHFVVLDTELAFQDAGRRQEQLNWLASDLAATSQPWRIVYFHRAPYSSGEEHGSDLAVRQAFSPILEQGGVQLALTAHEHIYERTVPLREGPQGNQAVTYLVTGGGGARLYPVGRNFWTAAARSAYHYVRGTLSGCQLTIEAVGLDGAVLDSYSLDRCRQEEDGAAPLASITSPSPGAAVSATVAVNVQATDDVRVEKVDLYIDGALSDIDATAPYQFSWDTRAMSDGNHTLQARAYDIAGNRVSSETITVRVANSAPPAADTIVLYASEAPLKAGGWTAVADSSAAGGSRIHLADAGRAKVSTPLANPPSYFEMTFSAVAGRPYRLWIRGKAQSDFWGNDSVYVQFSGSVNSGGAAVYRIGTTSGTEMNLEDCSGCGLSGWGWQDNGWGVGVLGPVIYFQTTGTQTIRVQNREDGLSIDQIVLSPSDYLNTSPGALKYDNTILPR